MINLTNYYEHPADNRYYIFEYRDVEKAMNFEDLLTDYNVEFEKLVEDESENTVWKTLYAIAKSDFSAALKANSLTEAKYRSPLISNVYARYAFIIIMMGFLVLAFIGYILSN